MPIPDTDSAEQARPPRDDHEAARAGVRQARSVGTRRGRCAFVGADGQCREIGWLEVHHVLPFARGGTTAAENLELRCLARNVFEAEPEFGARVLVNSGRSPRPMATPSGQSSAGFDPRFAGESRQPGDSERPDERQYESVP
jgi:hypothetical protein